MRAHGAEPAIPLHASILLLHKPIARVRVVVDAVLCFQFLDVVEISFCVWAGDTVAEGLAGVEQDFFQTTVRCHVLVLGEVVQECGEALFKTHRNVYPLDLKRRLCVLQAVAEDEVIAVEIADGVIAK